MSSNLNNKNKFFFDDDKPSTKKCDMFDFGTSNPRIHNDNILTQSTSNSRSNIPLHFREEKFTSGSTETIETFSRKYWHRGELMELVHNPIEELEFCTEVFLEQKIEVLEVLTGCETPNRYHVYFVNKQGQKKYLFKCKEESTWGCRNCCPSNSRAFEMKMIHISSTKAAEYKKTIANISRPFTCSCCCCVRPIISAVLNSDNKGGKFELGSVIENFSCNPSLTIFIENNKKKWKVKSKCCQCGLFCRCFSFGKFYEVDFWIYDANDNRKEPKAVGNIHKVFKGISELIADADAFLLTFPKNSTPYEKLMLIVAVLMIDYRYYEEKGICNLSSIL